MQSTSPGNIPRAPFFIFCIAAVSLFAFIDASVMAVGEWQRYRIGMDALRAAETLAAALQVPAAD
jgi:hypothetical protein